MRTTNRIVLSSAVTAMLLAGCADSEREASVSPSPASSPVASTTMDHAAMGHDMKAMDGGDHANGAHAMGTSGMESLRGKAGKEFDIAFLSQMIAHHAAAVQMAKDAASGATKPETKQEAQKVIDAQTREITQMTGWLKSWYNTAPNKAEQALVNADMKSMMEMPTTTDAMFFQMMIPHHQGAIDMSELALKNAARPELKKLAGQIITAQKAEIAEYQKLMKTGGG